MKKQGYWYKLSFTSLRTWNTFKNKYLIEDGNFKYGIQIIYEGKLSFPATFEDGKVLTEAGVYPDYAIDIVCDVEVVPLNRYRVAQKKNYKIGTGGFVGKIMVI